MIMENITVETAVPVPVPLDRVDMSALIARVDAARALFEAGDMRQALMLSEGAYDEAKAAYGFAARMKASEDVIARTNAMVCEALEIGSLAKVALANEYDRAQAAGVVATRGRPRKVAGEDLFHLSDFKLDKRVILDARKLRDAESKNPGVISRTIAVLSSEGVLPTKSNLRAAIGTASASKAERGNNFYQTPSMATIALLAHESFSATIWEPACGYNAIGRVLERQGYDVVLSDIEDRGTVSEAGEPQSVGDFLLSKPEQPADGPDIVTNPPYGADLNAFVAHALRVHRPRKLALLLNLNFLCGFADDDRSFVMDECPPSRVYVFKRRLPMMHREDYAGPKASSRMNTAWFVWELQEDGTYGSSTVMHRIDWADFAEADVLDAGEGGHSLGIHFDDAPRTTPKMTVAECVDRDREQARAWILQREDFSRRELCGAIGRRDTTGEALIAEFEAAGLISAANEPGREGRHLVLSIDSPNPIDRALYERAVAVILEMADDLDGLLIRATRVSSQLSIGWQQAIDLVKQIEADGRLNGPLPLPTPDELCEWKVLAMVRDGGGHVRVSGEGVEQLHAAGLINDLEVPTLSVAGEDRLRYLQRIVEAASDGDAVTCRPDEVAA